MKHVLAALSLLVALGCANLCAAQSPAYAALIRRAEAAYNAHHYDSSVRFYSSAFAQADGKGTANDRYNAACGWAMAGNVDSAFYNLFAIVQLAGWRDYGHLMADPDLEGLHRYKAWDVLRGQVRDNIHKYDHVADADLADELDDIHISDQKYRMRLDGVAHGSAQEKALWDTMNKYDAANLKRINQLLDTRGWLSRSQIGPRGVTTVFLVLQHADSATQAKYMPMMRKAVGAGELSKQDFALYEDRLLLRQGKKQIYGSQVQCRKDSCYVLPLEDPMHVDERRKAVGLEPLANYVGYWSIKWDAAAFEAAQKKQPSR